SLDRRAHPAVGFGRAADLPEYLQTLVDRRPLGTADGDTRRHDARLIALGHAAQLADFGGLPRPAERAAGFTARQPEFHLNALEASLQLRERRTLQQEPGTLQIGACAVRVTLGQRQPGG